MRVLVLGAGGMLGRALVATAPSESALSAFTRAELDITDPRALAATVARVGPEVIINAAAYTDVDGAESEPELALRVNADAVGALGRLAAHSGARVVHFSTDYIFDGRASAPYGEDDAPNPISAYGRSKLEGEYALATSGAAYLLIRTQWLFGPGGRSFPRTMWERAIRREATRAVSDQTGRPTSTEDLARATWRLVGAGATGTLHVANAGRATRYEVARRVFARQRAEELLTPCATRDFPTAAPRPARAVLDTTRADAVLGGPLPAWEESLDRLLEALRAQAAPLSASRSPESRPPR